MSFEKSRVEGSFEVSQSMVQREIQRELMETNRVLSEDLRRTKTLKNTSSGVSSTYQRSMTAQNLIDIGNDDTELYR